MSIQLNSAKEADLMARKVRRARNAIAALEETAEQRIERIRDQLVRQTAGHRAMEEACVGELKDYFNRNRANGDKSIKLQTATIGMHIVPRIFVPKGAVNHPDLPEEAMAIKVRVNKTALAALGEEAMAKVGAKVVRPQKFYVKTNDEDAEK